MIHKCRSDQNTRRKSVAKTSLGIIAAAALIILGTNTATAVVNGTEPDPTDTRLDAVAAFGRTVQLNGVEAEHNHYGNGTLIAPDLVISARHLLPVSLAHNNHPAPGTYSFRFRRNPDGSLGSKEQGWQSFHHVTVAEIIPLDYSNYGDVVLFRLSEPVTHITPMQIASSIEIAALIPHTDVVTTAGWGREGPGYGQGPLGRLLYAQPTLTGVDCSSITFQSAWSNDNRCACGPNVNDSGGAILIGGENGNPFKIVGVLSTASYGDFVNPITEPANLPAPIRDIRHDPVCAFGPTAWLTGDLSGESEGGNGREHTHRSSGVLISPTQVVIPAFAIAGPQPNDQTYNPNNLPPPGAFTVRFRRNPDGTAGSIAAGWQSFHQVAVVSYTVDPNPGNIQFLIANLAEPVTHIKPMRIASAARVETIEQDDPMIVSGWAWLNGQSAGHLAHTDAAINRICYSISLASGNDGVPDRCSTIAYDVGAAFVIERSSDRYTVLEEPLSSGGHGQEESTKGGKATNPAEPGKLPEVFADPDDSSFSTTPFDGGTLVRVRWFELVALGTRTKTSGNLLVASQLFDHCYFFDCIREPRPPLTGCADLNGDGVVDERDGDRILAAFGPCADCEECPADLNGDCVVDEADMRLFQRQALTGICPCLADFNLDGVVDILDYQYVLDNLGPCECDDLECPADLNDDRVVDFLDLLLVLNPPPSICHY